MFIAVGRGRRALRITAATSSATPMPSTLGPHCAKLPRNRARSAGNSSAGKIPAMKKTNAYSRARTRRRPAAWLSRSTGNPDEIARAVGSRASGCTRVTCSFMPGLSLGAAGYRRSSRALLSNRSVESSRSWVSASSCRRSWTPRSTSSSRAVTSADADCGRAARRRASLRTVYAGIPTNIRRAVRNTAGSKWLSSSATPVIREDVVSRLHDRVARESTLGVVPLRWRVGRGSGREPPGRGLILEHGPSPRAGVREPLAVLHHKVDVMQRARHRRCGERLQLFRVPVDLRHSGAVGERLAVARNAGPVGVDHHGIGEDRSKQASVLTNGDNLPVFVSPELREREPTRHLDGVLRPLLFITSSSFVKLGGFDFFPDGAWYVWLNGTRQDDGHARHNASADEPGPLH